MPFYIDNRNVKLGLNMVKTKRWVFFFCFYVLDFYTKSKQRNFLWQTARHANLTWMYHPFCPQSTSSRTRPCRGGRRTWSTCRPSAARCAQSSSPSPSCPHSRRSPVMDDLLFWRKYKLWFQAFMELIQAEADFFMQVWF